MIRTWLLLLLLSCRVFAGEATIHHGDTVLLSAVFPGEYAYAINNYYHVDESGQIDLPLIGKIVVEGLTAAEAAHVIDEGYLAKRVFSHPSATVSIGGPDPFVVVEGQVGQPMQVAIRPGLTLLQAITEAGGFTASADQEAVRLKRATTGRVIVCDVTRIIPHPELDMILHAGDKVRVEVRKP